MSGTHPKPLRHDMLLKVERRMVSRRFLRSFFGDYTQFLNVLLTSNSLCFHLYCFIRTCLLTSLAICTVHDTGGSWVHSRKGFFAHRTSINLNHHSATRAHQPLNFTKNLTEHWHNNTQIQALLHKNSNSICRDLVCFWSALLCCSEFQMLFCSWR